MSGGPRPGAGRKPGSPNKLTGRHKKTLTQIAQSYEKEAIETLASIMRDSTAPHAARATCADKILDRARGKPPQSLEHTGKGGGPIQHEDLSNLTDEQIAAVEAALRAAGATADAGAAPGGEDKTRH